MGWQHQQCFEINVSFLCYDVSEDGPLGRSAAITASFSHLKLWRMISPTQPEKIKKILVPSKRPHSCVKFRIEFLGTVELDINWVLRNLFHLLILHSQDTQQSSAGLPCTLQNLHSIKLRPAALLEATLNTSTHLCGPRDGATSLLRNRAKPTTVCFDKKGSTT